MLRRVGRVHRDKETPLARQTGFARRGDVSESVSQRRTGAGSMSAFRVFLSAVSSEFGLARAALTNDLQAHEVTV